MALLSKVKPPDNCFYTDHNNIEHESVYGCGWFDGVEDAYQHRVKHHSVFPTVNDTSTRRAYVTGYIDGYNAQQQFENREAAK